MNSFEQKSGNDYSYVYRDTMEFINIIVEEYGFYDDIINLIRNGETEISIKKRKLTKTIDEDWIRAIEDSLVALDSVIRKPSITIQENEMVMPIELSRSINARSIQHLSQHTNYISRIEGDEITPSKILNVFRDETNNTYENKFVNTLIERLYMFVQKRYDKLFGESAYQNSTQMEVNTKIVSGSNEAKINFSIEFFNKSDEAKKEKDDTQMQEALKLAEENDSLSRESDELKDKIQNINTEIDDIISGKTEVSDDESDENAPSETEIVQTIVKQEIKEPTLRERVEQIYSVVQGYINSEFVKKMDKKFVRPPIIRTNAITKNKNLRQCLLLWEFIESYDGIGCQIDIEETAENPNKEYINDLYSVMALQYVMFKYNISENLDDVPLAENSTDEPLMPKILTDFEEYDSNDYDVHDVEYKKLFTTDFSKRLTSEQLHVRSAIEVALEADKLIKKLKVLELLAEEKMRQEARVLEEKLKLQELKEEKLRQIEFAKKKKLSRKAKKRLKKQALKSEEEDS